ncbi:energy transducer TonB [Shewanella sp. GXUN23E]|uniref:energy transducer TonB n=1 Tax=Shewanella sp. GXUN23E TaxID=3422498 RepID=UPI003D7EBA75
MKLNAVLPTLLMMGTASLALTASWSVNAQTSAAQPAFADALAGYLTAVDNQDAQGQLLQARLAYELGKAEFGQSHVNTANLAMNYAHALGLKANYLLRSAPEEDFPTQTELLQYAVSVYEKEYGPESTELVEPLLKLARSYYIDNGRDFNTKKKNVLRAVELSKTLPPLVRAEVYIQASHILSSEYRSLSRRYAEQAYDLYVEHAPENAVERNLAAFNMAKFYMGERRYDQAESMLKDVIAQFSVLQYDTQVSLAAHAFLVELYERKGERELATEHCLAIGSMTPWLENQEQTPIFRTLPDFPTGMAKRNRDGLVQMSFTIDKTGFVKDVEVIKSDGGAAFERSAIKAMQEWRYAPKFENGKPVEAQSTVQLDFLIRR